MVTEGRNRTIAAICNWVMAQLMENDGRQLLEGKAVAAAVGLLGYERADAAGEARLGLGRIVVSEIEVPNMLTHMV